MTTPREAALRVAVLDALAKRVNKSLADARGEAEQLFAVARAGGATQIEVALPSGAAVGKVSIKAGQESIRVDEAALLKWVLANQPEEIEAEVSPSALSRPDVIAYVRKLHPDLMRQKVRPAYRAKLLAEVNESGELASETTGEVVKVSETVKSDPTGAFALTFETAKKGKPNGRDQIAAAWQSGELSITELIRPAIEGAPGGES
ncbi:hypothetical protein OG884_18340 [Streptosporangium sp. NBC_01755]|uniref:hypothetical protein n=1 Tax=Streptosporangium sp. NBC_01755 TaxID=2975949 RepID=UPI002DD872EB|nr:hypothetical protein [Streptosporangium sp. NBC_01755]WSD03766.1 hypothetical protein OG884_18340 [Streptosporangium sp. NBC_01755]